MNYYAVTRTGNSDELTHWKYIKRVKGKNGKWRYYYDNSEIARYDNNAKRTFKNADGSIERSVEWKNTDGLLSYTNESKMTGKDWKTSNTTHMRGKIDQFVDRYRDKGESWVYNKFFKNKNGSSKKK